MTEPSLTALVELYERYGPQRYDEELSQLAHAEQTAALAQQAGATDALVVAALLHDVGHLLELAERQGPRDRITDQRHEARGAAWLASLFPAAVTSPVALHVRAKRYLCAVDPAYAQRLSPGSVASLQRQGGPMDPAEASAFESNQGWEDAVTLRRWDDQAKLPDLVVTPFQGYRPLLEALSPRNLW